VTVVVITLVLAVTLAVAGGVLVWSARREEERGAPPPLPLQHPLPAPATPAAIDIQAAGRARLEAAVQRARSRLADRPGP
jgi:hypothetical protein